MLQQQVNLTRGVGLPETLVQFHHFRGADGSFSPAGRPLPLEAFAPMRTDPAFFHVCRVYRAEAWRALPTLPHPPHLCNCSR